MAIDDADQADAGQFSEGEASHSVSEDQRSHASDTGVRVGEYTWADFMEEHGHGDEVSELYPDDRPAGDQLGLDTDGAIDPVPQGEDWNRVEFDPESYLGFHPDRLESLIADPAKPNAEILWDEFLDYVDPETTPVVKDVYTWEHYKWEYYYEDDGSRPRDSDGEIVRHDEEEALGFDPDTLEDRLSIGDDIAMELDDVVEERTVNVEEDLEEDEFFSTAAGNTTVTNRYDLEKAVPMDKKTHFQEVERYWVNKPYACVVIFHSEKENEKKYYMIEPYQNEIEMELQEFLSGKLRTAIKYSEEGIKEKATEDGRRDVIEEETRRLLKRYDLFEKTSSEATTGILETMRNLLDDDGDDEEVEVGPSQLEGIEVRPEPAILEDDPDTLNEYQVEKLLYLLKRNFIGYERIDGIKHDINVEDISVDGYNSPVFVYHSEYEQIISNIYHGEEELDDFVVKLAQRSGKGISKRLPQVDATLPDGSRAQLTLGKEVSDHGTNYTIRQFKDVPFTPIDLINWNTFSLDEMAFLWLCIENHKSLIFAGGTASGKTTSLNAVSLFIPSSAKIVSIEDTREVELPQRNWIASVTRPSFADDEQGDVDEFDLLEAALRQRPDYIVMGEIRGEEGRTLFQVMSTGHTTYTTFHADSVDEVLKRFTTDPINVSKTMFTALDLVSIQTQTRVQGNKVRRNKSLTEINHYEAEHDEINVQDVYQWQAETDEFLKMGDSNTLEEIQFDRGWNSEKLEDELFKREVILAYLIRNELNTYAEVAATVQAFINDPDTILTLIANGQLEDSLEDLREMESVLIDVDQEKEELVPRPDATSETYNLSMDILERAEESLFDEYRGKVPSGLASALGDVEEESTIEVDSAETEEFDFAGAVDDDVGANEWELGDGATDFGAGTTDAGDDEPAWLDDDTGFDIGSDDTEPDPARAEATASAGAGADASESPAAASGGSTGDVGTADGTTDESVTLPDTVDRDEPEVRPSDDAEEGDLGGLFDDMGETLDRMEDDSGGDAPAATTGTDTEPDTSGFDAMFPDDDLDSIFDPSAEDEPSNTDFSDQLESEAPDVGTDATEPDAPSGADTGSADRGETAGRSAIDHEEPDATAPDDVTDATSATDDDPTGDDATPPTIELGDGTETDDPTSDDSAGTDAAPPGAESSDPPSTDGEDASGDGVSGADTETDPVADRSAESTADASGSVDGTDAADEGDAAEDGSIFGEDSESIFSDDADDGDDGGSLFDDTDDGSPFADDADEDGDSDGGGSLFDDADDDSIFKGEEANEESEDGIFGGGDEESDT
ncbi:ATPase, T2SS/T4P/T4SS family [Halosolutus amylolyticus]|uniref:ATPase, T2SS/T4P/T4SS family n=1 Tax=Halosolutus amylolyticus TaxID=2932267 RepID=A0ABD5PUS1_9EURY|nr:ATPase, T2SS/T4P/T4SS family [Halosolutus amylolyticus]